MNTVRSRGVTDRGLSERVGCGLGGEVRGTFRSAAQQSAEKPEPGIIRKLSQYPRAETK